MNMAMAVVDTFGGALPTRGPTLPLVGYGSSSPIAVRVLIALILRVDHEDRAWATERAARRAA